MADTWKNDGVRIEELEGRVREFERLIAVVAETATAMADQLRKALVVTTAIPMRPSEVALLLERAAERDEAIAHARRWEDKAEEYRANAIRFGDERDALLARVAELEAEVYRLQSAPTATQERARIGIWLRNQSYETQWAGDLDFKKTAARIEAGEHWPQEEGQG